MKLILKSIKRDDMTTKEYTNQWDSLLHKYNNLQPIRNKADHAKAVEALLHFCDEVEGKTLGINEKCFLDTLTSRIEDYEKPYADYFDDKYDGIDILRFLMDENGLNQSDISRIIDADRSVASRILNRKRDLTIGQVNILADYFSVEPGVFVKVKANKVKQPA